MPACHPVGYPIAETETSGRTEQTSRDTVGSVVFTGRVSGDTVKPEPSTTITDQTLG